MPLYTRMQVSECKVWFHLTRQYYSQISIGSPIEFCLCWAADSLKMYFPAQNLNGLSIFPPSQRHAVLIGVLWVHSHLQTQQCKNLWHAQQLKLQRSVFSHQARKSFVFTGSSSAYPYMSNLVSWGSHIYSVGGIEFTTPFLGSKIFNPSATGSGLWQEIMNGSLISESRYHFSTLLVPASMIPNLPPGCVGLQKSNLTSPHLKQKLTDT